LIELDLFLQLSCLVVSTSGQFIEKLDGAELNGPMGGISLDPIRAPDDNQVITWGTHKPTPE